jgi:hypothetical protein
MKIYTLTEHKVDPNGGDGTTTVVEFGWRKKAGAEAYKTQHEVYRDTEFAVHELTVLD